MAVVQLQNLAVDFLASVKLMTVVVVHIILAIMALGKGSYWYLAWCNHKSNFYQDFIVPVY